MRGLHALLIVLPACSGEAERVPTLSIDGCLGTATFASLRVEVRTVEGTSLTARCWEVAALPQTVGLAAVHHGDERVMVRAEAFAEGGCGGAPLASSAAQLDLADLDPAIYLDPACDQCACPCGQCPAAAAAADLLFVIDDSNSMAEEQAALTRAFPRLMASLQQTVLDLHVGVISTDIGVGDPSIATCEDPDGDDGVLQHAPSPLVGGCSAGYPPFLAGPPADLGDDFACVATLGTGGCGFEQPLESILRALTTQAGAGRPNAGFLREGTTLGIVVLTDEDDCSIADPSILDPADPSPANLRCITRPEGLTDPNRTVAALRALDRPVVFAVFAGVPLDWSGSLEALEPTIDPGHPDSILPICSGSGGLAYPARRLAETALAFGPRGLVRSICRDDLGDALDAVGGAIANAAGP